MSYDVEEWTSSLTCAKTWLDDCIDNHSTCTFDEDADFYPTRLLNIGNITSPLVFLETDISEPASQIRYATLSHCWGGSNVLRLTTSTMLRMQRGIPIADLAKTFQDAIFVAQQLGVHWFWIDVRNVRVRTACETYTDFVHLPLVPLYRSGLERGLGTRIIPHEPSL
jgi:hypothetical protein